MAATKLYFTDTEADTDQTASAEVLLAFEIPGSGTIVESPASSCTVLVGSTPSGQPGSSGSWDDLPGGDCQTALDVSANNGVVLTTVQARRMNAALVSQANDLLSSDYWDSDSGTGVKTYTPDETIDIGTASADDRYCLEFFVFPGGDITIDLGSDSWVEVPWAITGTELTAIRPADDITTTGWTDTPLWSKVDEESPDATVITATAS